jgi:hypothetical protein
MQTPPQSFRRAFRNYPSLLASTRSSREVSLRLYAPGKKFLSYLNDDEEDLESVSSPTGPYGNESSSESVNNKDGEYGSEFGSKSARNEFGSDESPMIFTPDGQYLGRLNPNKFDSESISNEFGKYGSEYNSDSMFSPYGKYASYTDSETVDKRARARVIIQLLVGRKR